MHSIIIYVVYNKENIVDVSESPKNRNVYWMDHMEILTKFNNWQYQEKSRGWMILHRKIFLLVSIHQYVPFALNQQNPSLKFENIDSYILKDLPAWWID